METLATVNFADKDLTSKVLLASCEVPAEWTEPELVQAEVGFTSLAGGGANYTLYLSKTPDGGSELEYLAGARVLDGAAAGRRFAFAPVRVQAGDTLKVYALSSAAADNAVGGTASFDVPTRTALSAAAMTALPAMNVGSTSTPLPLGKALEVLLAVAAGVAGYDAGSGVWTVRGADGVTPVARITLTGSGNRPSVELP